MTATCVFSQSSDITSTLLREARAKYHLISSREVIDLQCQNTITVDRMKQFFVEFPEFHEKVKMVNVPNCYGQDPSIKLYVLVYEQNGIFDLPISVPGSYRP